MPQEPSFSLFEDDVQYQTQVNLQVKKDIFEGLEDLMALALKRTQADVRQMVVEASLRPCKSSR